MQNDGMIYRDDICDIRHDIFLCITENGTQRKKINKASGGSKKKVLEYRQILFDLANKWVKTPVYRRSELQPGFGGEGPAVIEEPSSTVVVYPGMKFNVDQFGIIHIMT